MNSIRLCSVLLFSAILPQTRVGASTNWPQFQLDSRHSGNAVRHRIETPLGLIASAPLSDAIFTAPAIVNGRVFVVDGSGVAWCFDAQNLKPIWRTPTDGGPANCNNVSSPAVVAGHVHFGTTAGDYYVLRADTGAVVAKIAAGDPIFSCPVIADDQKSVYFATLGSRVYAVTPEGRVRWSWDYVREILKFNGDRWSGADWAAHKKGRVSWKDQFLCSRDMAARGKTLVIPAGGTIVWLDDAGDRAVLRAGYTPKESPATYGLSIGDDGAVYRQWYRRDNTGSVEVLRLDKNNQVKIAVVPGTQTNYESDEGLSFSPVALRGDDIYRTRPETGLALCRHTLDKPRESLGAYPSIAPAVLAGDHAITCGLDGAIHIIPIDGHTNPKRKRGADDRASESTWTFKTPFNRPITAPIAVADSRIYFGGEDGYLYLLGPNGNAAAPTKELDLTRLRAPTTAKSPENQNWFTNFGDLANTNRAGAGDDFAPPLAMRWIRRVEGTIKHSSVHGGGRMYTHTAEGQILAVEEETGRLLWRTYYPGVHACYTAPIYHQEKILVPQAGFDDAKIRCLDAATGRLAWEAPFTGSPSWNRQLPPIVHDGRVFYCYSTGKFRGKNWLFEHQSTHGFPADHKPLVKAWDLATGRELWSLDFSDHGAGGDDAGLCLMDGRLYYSCYFGNKKPPGVTAAIDPASGKILWKNTDYAVHGGCTISAKDGRLYLGGYNAVGGKTNHVWCLDARDGSLVWMSDPIGWAIHVVTIADDRLFTHHQYQHGTLLDRATGRKVCDLAQGYYCTRFTMCGKYLLGANMDIIDTTDKNRLVSSGPAVDVILCTGAHVSNGRLYFTANGGGLQLSMAYGEEAQKTHPFLHHRGTETRRKTK
jgi:outer membrane protein assembly factor BamB